MTQEKANEIFKTELGIQLDVIYVTSDDKVFIRYNEALLHTNDLLNGDPENFVDTTITEWYNENSKKMKKSKNKKDYQLPSVDGIDVMGLLSQIEVKKIPAENNALIDFIQRAKKEQKIINPEESSQSKKINTPPTFTLDIGVPANNIAKQLKKQKIEFDPSVIKTYDKLIKGIVGLRNEKFISKKKSVKLIFAVYEKSVNHVYFIYEMFVKSKND